MLFRRAILALTLGALQIVNAAPAVKKPVRSQPAAKTIAKPAKTSGSAQASAVAQRWLKSLDLHDEIAQLIVMPFYGDLVNVRSKQFRQYQKLIADVHVGGMIVLGHSVYGSIRNAEPYAMTALVNRMQAMSAIPLLVAADFERGASMRVNSTTAWPYNMAFAAGGDLSLTRAEGAATAREARAMGVNWLFAPDADVNNNPDNPIINIRSYGENPKLVAAHVQAYIEGAHSDPKEPVLVTVKHFPGHGDTSQDSHLGLAKLTASKDRIDKVEMIPFRAAIDKGVDAVMTAHMAVPALEPDEIPATVSHNILTGLLREQMKFHGLIVTDAMNMQGLTQMFDTREAAVRSIEAGADVLLMPIRAEEAIDGVIEAVKAGRITKKRLDESALRVLTAKAQLGLNRSRLADLHKIAEVLASPEDEEKAQAVADRAVTLVKDQKDLVPLRKSGTTSLLILTESRSGTQGRKLIEEMRKRSSDLKITLLDPGMSKDDLDLVAKDALTSQSIVVAAYATVNAYRGNVALPGEYTSLMNTLLAGTVPVTLAAMGNPYLIRAFPGVAAYITTYSATPTADTALAKSLFGEIGFTGRLPVNIPGIAKIGDGIQHPASSVQKGL